MRPSHVSTGLVPVLVPVLLLGLAGCGKTHLFPIRALDASLGGPPIVDAAPETLPAERIEDAGLPAPDLQGRDSADRDLPIITTCPASLQLGYSTLAAPGGAATTTTTTGGEGGVTVLVNTAADLIAQAARTEPLVIRIGGTLTLTGPVPVKSDKTLEGVAPGDGLTGAGLFLKDSHNVIIRKLTLTNPLAPNDSVNLSNAQNVWIDHCDLSSNLEDDESTFDDLIDITHGSDWVTISWNVFHDHYHTSQVGNSPNTGIEDMGHLHVTYHHNWFRRTVAYNPRVRFGSVHVFNNLYEYDVNHPGTAIVSERNAEVLVEGNTFKYVAQPVTTTYGDLVQGTAWFVNNIRIACGANLITIPKEWAPPYPYTVEASDYAEAVVTACAGPAH